MSRYLAFIFLTLMLDAVLQVGMRAEKFIIFSMA